MNTFSILFHQTSVQGGYKILFVQNGLEYDENLVSLDVKMKRVDDKTLVNVRSELYSDIDDPIVVHVSHFEMNGNEYEHLLNTSVNICNVMTRVKSHPILKIILTELLKASNFPTSCPIKQDVYYMKDFSVNDDLLPPFLPLGKFMSRVRVVRIVDEAEVPLLKINILVDIDNARDRKTFKLF